MISRYAVRTAVPLLLCLACAVPAAARNVQQPQAQPTVVQPAQTPAAVVQPAPTQTAPTQTAPTQTAPVQISVTTPPQTQAVTPMPPRPLPTRPASTTVVLVLIALLGLVGIAFLLMIRHALKDDNSGWSLASALSESEPTPFLAANGNPIRENGTTGPLLMTAKLQPSTSRLIALMGLFGILLLYLGFGAVILYYFGTGQNLPAGIDEVQSFLLAGLTLFAPYVVNKFADVLKTFARR